MAVTIHNVVMPVGLSFGSSGGPGFKTNIVQTVGGYEFTNQVWAKAKAKYDVSHNAKDPGRFATLLNFWHGRRGRAYGFLFKDWGDYRSSASMNILPTSLDQVIGVGDGHTKVFRLVKTYPDVQCPYVRPINFPTQDSVLVAVGGVTVLPGVIVVNYWGGFVTFLSAPAVGAQVTAGYEFYVPVRFDTDDLNANLADYQSTSWSNIPLVEIRPDFGAGG